MLFYSIPVGVTQRQISFFFGHQVNQYFNRSTQTYSIELGFGFGLMIGISKK